MNVIEVSGLTKTYGDRAVVDGVSFAVEEGEIFGILGPNGAGKTTTVESIAGFAPRMPAPSRPRTRPRRDRGSLRTLVGVQLQESELPDRMTVREALDLFAVVLCGPADPTSLIGTSASRPSAIRPTGTCPAARSSASRSPSPDRPAADRDPRRALDRLDPQARRETWQLIEDVRERGVTVCSSPT
jgi:ABC-2 type transport system ATP-binding protein